jgi:RimJ/RimL family protein N-acetyltransferase
MKFSLNRSFSTSLRNFFNLEIVFENPNILISPLNNAHIAQLSPILNYPSLWVYNPKIICKDENDIKSYFAQALIQKEAEERFPLVIYSKKNKAFAGTTSFYNISLKNKTIRIGYTIITPDFQKTGINQVSKKMMIDWCFNEMGFERIEFRVDKLNKESRLSLKKLGAVEEGILRNELLTVTGRWRDTVILSILKNEWIQKDSSTKESGI